MKKKRSQKKQSDLFTEYDRVQLNIYESWYIYMYKNPVRVTGLVYFSLFGILLQISPVWGGEGGGGGAGSHNISGLLPSRILNAGGGGGQI